jgi:16S rRNA (uracil1498-N3)-methyltransferase
MRRIYQAFTTLKPGAVLRLSDEAHHHLFTVLRSKENEEIVFFNGQGQSWRARIQTVSKKFSEIELIESIEENTESPLKIHLAQAVSKGERMDLVMQKATELGVTEITPILTERGNVKLDQERWDKKLAHWHQIMVSACEQSGRSVVPVLNPVIDLKTWFTQLPEGLRLILSPTAMQPLKADLKPEQVTLLIGPEGGLTEQEIAFAMDRFQFQPLQIGPRVLRTETAALAALSILQFAWGDLA